MTLANLNKFKEHLSQHFVQLLAQAEGYSCVIPNSDTGVDLKICRVVRYAEGAQIRERETGESLDIQLKTTTEKQVMRSASLIKYKLRRQNYNDLVQRNIGNQKAVPLMLVLYVLPNDMSAWLQHRDAQLILEGEAFFYKCKSLTLTNNRSTQTIEIPLANVLSSQTLSSCFNESYPPL